MRIMMKKIFLLSVISVAFFAVISGCSSAQRDTSIISGAFDGTALIPADVSRLCVEEIENRSSRDEIPGMLMSELRRRFNFSGRLYLTDDISSCDVKLRITLLPLITEPLDFNSAGIPEQRRLRLDALITMTHSSTGDEVMKNREAYAEVVFRVAGRDSISEYRGITGLTEKLSERIISVITTGWFKDDNN